MEYRQLKYFETVAKLGNITRAAAELSISQPPLSQQIKMLENDLGFKLFIRHSKGIRLTKDGVAFLQRVRPLIKQFEELSSEVHGSQNGTKGHLSIATIPALTGLLSKAIDKIWKDYPDLYISLHEGHANSVVSLVKNRDVHIGITRLPIINQELNFSIIGDDPVNAFLNRNDPLAKAERIYPSDLNGRKLVLLQFEDQRSGFLQIARTLEESNAEPIIVGRMERISTLFQIVKHGDYITLVPNSSKELAP